MSHNYSYRDPSNSFRSRQDTYSDSYQQESDMYRLGSNSVSQDSARSTTSSIRASDPSDALPGKALSFLHSCGLDVNDLALLAEQPEHLITVETLPKLLLQLKEHKLSCSSSSRSSTTQHCSSTSSHSYTEVVEYPLVRPTRPTCPLPPEQIQSWQDSWGNPQQPAEYTSPHPKTGPVLDYSKVEEPYYSESSFHKQAYASAAPSPSTATSRSFAGHGRERRQSFEYSYPATIEPLPKVPTRKEASDFHGRAPPVFPYACILCNITVLSAKDWSLHISGPQHANSQLLLVEKYPQWDQKIESTRRNESQASPHVRSSERRGEATRDNTSDRKKTHDVQTKEVKYKVPTRKEASDFQGKVPPVFPYACILCDITVLSERDWSLHIGGPQHANSQFRLVEKYPKWDQRIESSRRNETSQSRSTETRGEKKESKKEHSSVKKKNTKPEQETGKVVCVKFPANAVEEKYLKKLLGQFGAVVKIMMYPTKALVEMGTPDQTADIVKYFTSNPLKLKGALIQFSISDTFSLLQSSCVVSFAPLPAGEGIASELTAIAKRFGSVKVSLFLPSRGYVEMTNFAEAKNLVEHYSANPLKLKGKIIQVTLSTEFTVLRSEPEDDSKEMSVRSDNRRKNSPRRVSSEREPPSPKRRRSSKSIHSSERKTSSERRHSSRSYSSKEREDTRRSKENSRSSSRRLSHSPHSPPKDKTSKSSEDAEAKAAVCNDSTTAMDSDSDLEGLEVIADDLEELQHFDDKDDESTTDGHEIKKCEEQKMCEEDGKLCHQTLRTSAAMAEQNTSTDMVKMKPENLPPDQVDIPSVTTITEDAQNVDSSKMSGSIEEGQIFKEQTNKTMETEENSSNNFDFPDSIENCITLDEIVDDELSGHQDGEPESSTEKIEDKLDVVAKTTDDSAPDVDPEKSKMQTNYSTEESSSRTSAGSQSSEQESGAHKDTVHLSIEKPNTEPELNQAFIEMARETDAEKVIADSKTPPVTLCGSVSRSEVSEKCNSSSTEGKTETEENVSNDSQASNGVTEPSCTSAAVAGPETEPSNDHKPTYEPVGTEFVRPVVGYFCNLCNVIYASEEEAKDEHCRTPSHHEKLKEHMEKKKTGQ